MGAKEASILAAVGAEKIEDIDLAKLEVLIGLGTAIKDGETTLETAFPGAAPATDGKPIFKEEPKAVPAAPEQPVAAPAAPEPVAVEPAGTAQERLAAVVTDAGFTLDTFNRWCIDTGFLQAEVGTWAEVPEALAARCLKGAKGLVAQLKEVAK
jgi:hypothetical protein